MLFNQSTIIQTAFNKVITGRFRSGSSVAFRIYRGFAVFQKLPVLFKIIGVGHGNLGNFVIENSIVTKYDPSLMTETAADYASSASVALLYYGIIGFLLLGYIYWHFLKNTKYAFRLISICEIIMSFVAGGLFGIKMVFYFSLIYAGYIKEVSNPKKGIVHIKKNVV